MSAICGVLRLNGNSRPGKLCRSVLAAQARYGPHDQSMKSLSDVALGRALYRLVPEDRYDLQPVRGGGERFLLVADLRLDNRDDVIAGLGRDARESRNLSDSQILLSAFERWGESVFDRLVGAFAVAIWDGVGGRLILARDPTGQRPLHYHRNSRFFAFSSTPSGLHALEDVPRVPDEERLAQFISMVPSDPERSFFHGISSVLNGHLMVVTQDGVIRSRQYWNPSIKSLRLARPDDYVDAYREQLDRAVRAQLRGADGLVAAHLSSGFDSSAVASTAARLLAPEGGRVLAITAAPRKGYEGAVPRGRIADESAIAAETAALHSNIEHLVIRPSGERLLAVLDRDGPTPEEPLRHICNNLWWRAANAAAHANGARILLAGDAGNLTISAGNIYQLSEMVQSGKWIRWLSEARSLIAGGTMRWRGVLAASFGPWTPLPIWNALSRTFLGTSSRLGPDLLVGPYWRKKLVETVPDTRLPRDLRASRLLALQSASRGTYGKHALAEWGVDERDPTADRGLAEFCLSLPPEMLLNGGVTRALARRALADRLPRSVLHSSVRGLQLADWHEFVGPDDAARVLESAQDCEAVRRVIDVERLRSMIAEWPTGGWERYSVIGEYRQTILKTLSVVSFLRSACES